MRVRNWREYQHYDPGKRAAPPWIRLYRKVLDDQEWYALSGDAAKMLVMLWLLAAEADGQLPNSIPRLSFRLRATEQSIIKHLPALLHWIEGERAGTGALAAGVRGGLCSVTAPTRQSSLYRSRRRAGLCVECGAPAAISDCWDTMARCVRHSIRKRRQVRRLRGGEPWRKGGPGRRPSAGRVGA